MVEDGERVVKMREINILEMLLMKFCFVRNKINQASKPIPLLLKQNNVSIECISQFTPYA